MKRPDSWRRAPGWYPDPGSPEGLRWWDGTQWIRQAGAGNPMTEESATASYPPVPTPYAEPAGPDSSWAQYSPAAGPSGVAGSAPAQKGSDSSRFACPPQFARPVEDGSTVSPGCLSTFVFSRAWWTVIGLVIIVPILIIDPLPLGIATSVLVLIVGVTAFVLIREHRARRGKQRRRTTSSSNISSQGMGVAKPPSLREIMSGLRVIDLDLPLSEQFDVAGESSHRRDIKAVFAEAGSPVTATGTTLEEVPAALCPYSWGYSGNPFAAGGGDVAVMVGERHVGNLPRTASPRYYPLIRGFASQGIAIACQLRLWARTGERGIKAQASVRIPSVKDLTTRLSQPM